MLKASESNNHAELEVMKLSLLEKTKQEVLEQLRRLDEVMTDINVKP
jgi:hypothetical protein